MKKFLYIRELLKISMCLFCSGEVTTARRDLRIIYRFLCDACVTMKKVCVNIFSLIQIRISLLY